MKKRVEEARNRFIQAVKEANEGRSPKNLPVPGHTGAVKGSSEKSLPCKGTT